MSLIVNEDLIELGHPNRSGKKLLGIKARVWHGTANWNSGADDIMNGKYAGRKYVKSWDNHDMKWRYFEADGKTPFAYGAAHVYIDKDSAVIKIPLDEITPNCGDRQLDYNNGYKGQTKLAKEVFNNMNNSYTLSIELCMNDMKAWDKVLDNALEFIKLYMPNPNIADYRHYDLTAKVCPSPFVDLTIKEADPRWIKFRERIKGALS